MIKALVFDLDGVIIDSERISTEVTLQILKDAGVESDSDEISKFVGMQNEKMWTILIDRYQIKEFVEQLMKKQKDYIIEWFLNGELEPIDGVMELLEEARRKNLKIGLATSAPRDYAEYILNKIKAAEYFKVLVTSDEITKSKPDPEVYITAANALGIKPGECVAIEDSTAGIQAAKSAGMKCIGYKNPNSGNQDTSKADYAVASIREIVLDSID
ncbi:MAG: HAD family hydrolase [Acetivibrionales bacterium]|jgi:HAD superfamily hydrolase (TIGR01509 family)